MHDAHRLTFVFSFKYIFGICWHINRMGWI